MRAQAFDRGAEQQPARKFTGADLVLPDTRNFSEEEPDASAGAPEPKREPGASPGPSPMPLPRPIPMPIPVPVVDMKKEEDRKPRAPKVITPAVEIEANLGTFALAESTLPRIRQHLADEKAPIQTRETLGRHRALLDEVSGLFEAPGLPRDEKNKFLISVDEGKTPDGKESITFKVHVNQNKWNDGVVGVLQYVDGKIASVKAVNTGRLTMGFEPVGADQRAQFFSLIKDLSALPEGVPVPRELAMKIGANLEEGAHFIAQLSKGQAEALFKALTEAKAHPVVSCGLLVRMGYDPRDILKANPTKQVERYLWLIERNSPDIIVWRKDFPAEGAAPKAKADPAPAAPISKESDLSRLLRTSRSRETMRDRIMSARPEDILSCDPAAVASAMRYISDGISSSNKDALAHLVSVLYSASPGHERLHQVAAEITKQRQYDGKKMDVWYIRKEIGSRLSSTVLDELTRPR